MQDIFPLLFVFFIAIAILSFFFSNKAVVKRNLKQHPLRSIASVKEDEIVKIAGKAEAIGAPLIAPISGKKCVYYHVTVEERRKNTDDESKWHDILNDELYTAFVIREGDQYAMFDMRHTQRYIIKDTHHRTGYWDQPTPEVDAYLKQHDIKSKLFFGGAKPLRYREGIIEPEEEICALGKATWKDAEALHLPKEWGRILYLYATEDQKLYFSDAPDTLGDTIA